MGNVKKFTKQERLIAYKLARNSIENINNNDGLCWALAAQIQAKVILLFGKGICDFICDTYPEFALFKPEPDTLWWFNQPTEGMNESRIARLIILDLCIEILS